MRPAAAIAPPLAVISLPTRRRTHECGTAYGSNPHGKIASARAQGRVAQLGERRVRNAEVRSSILLTSTILSPMKTAFGLILLVAATIVGTFPLLPARARGGTIGGAPHAPALAAVIGVAGVLLLLWARRATS